jgi:hypothetical protein
MFIKIDRVKIDQYIGKVVQLNKFNKIDQRYNVLIGKLNIHRENDCIYTVSGENFTLKEVDWIGAYPNRNCPSIWTNQF